MNNNNYINDINNPQQNNNNYNANMNNQPQNNNTYNNTNIDDNNNDLNKKKRNVLIILAAIIACLIIFKIFSNLFFDGNHKNNTGSSEYSSKDVGLNCIYTSNDKKITVYSDFIFNYNNSQNDYKLKMYNKKINEYPEGLTDEKYFEFINNNFESYCYLYSDIDCKSNHIEFGISSLGMDTVVDRKKIK